MSKSIKARLREPLVGVILMICGLLVVGLIINRADVERQSLSSEPVMEVSDYMIPEPDERGFVAFRTDGIHHVVHIANMEVGDE